MISTLEQPPASREVRPASTVVHPAVLPELPPPIELAGMDLLPLTRRELIQTLVVRAGQRRRTVVHYLNAHVFNLARKDPALLQVFQECDLLYADGISIVWAARRLGYSIPERLTAADYFEEFCESCAAEGLSLFLLGGAAGVAEVAAARLTRNVPGLRIAGTSHGYLSPAESGELVNRINHSSADVLVVGMTSPSQERWIQRYGRELDVPVQWSVGALLDYFAGAEPRAPEWVCRWGGEWAFRLMIHPSQRWRRYLLGNAAFAWWLGGEYILPGRTRN